jgi:predicted RNase H-like nuclease (RuvC/YqgF family)
MDAKLTELIIRLETRTRQLLLQYGKSQEEKKELQLRLKERDAEILSLRQKNEELQQQYTHLKMAKYIDMADDDVKDLRGRIRKMVRDVDRCISMLKVE